MTRDRFDRWREDFPWQLTQRNYQNGVWFEFALAVIWLEELLLKWQAEDLIKESKLRDK